MIISACLHATVFWHLSQSMGNFSHSFYSHLVMKVTSKIVVLHEESGNHSCCTFIGDYEQHFMAIHLIDISLKATNTDQPTKRESVAKDTVI